MAQRFIAYIDGLSIDRAGARVERDDAAPAALSKAVQDFAVAQGIPFYNLPLRENPDQPATISDMATNVARKLFPLQLKNSWGGDLVTSGSGLHVMLQAFSASKLLFSPDLWVSLVGVGGPSGAERSRMKEIFNDRPIRRLVTVTAHHDPLSPPDLNDAFRKVMAPVMAIGGTRQQFVVEGTRVTAANLTQILPHVMNGFGG